jgi:hypothetical protein
LNKSTKRGLENSLLKNCTFIDLNAVKFLNKAAFTFSGRLRDVDTQASS